MIKMVKKKRNYLMSFPDIENVVWEAIYKYTIDKSFSNTWLVLQIKDFKIKKGEIMEYDSGVENGIREACNKIENTLKSLRGRYTKEAGKK